MTTAPVAVELSPSSLAYLFASRFVDAAKPGTMGMESFATSGVVDTKVLAVNLPIIALWSLRESGDVEIEQYRPNVALLFGTPLHAVRARLLNRPVSTGYEERLLILLERHAKRHQRGLEAGELFAPLVPESHSPSAAVIRRVINELVSKGYLRQIEHEPEGFVKVHTGAPNTISVEAIPERYADLDAAAVELSGRWRTFLADESDLHAKLYRAVRTLIEDNEKPGLVEAFVNHYF